MANFKRKKSRRSIRCSICTPYRWLGNHKERTKFRDKREMLRGID